MTLTEVGILLQCRLCGATYHCTDGDPYCDRCHRDCACPGCGDPTEDAWCHECGAACEGCGRICGAESLLETDEGLLCERCLV